MTDPSFEPDAAVRLDARLGAAFQAQERQSLSLPPISAGLPAW